MNDEITGIEDEIEAGAETEEGDPEAGVEVGSVAGVGTEVMTGIRETKDIRIPDRPPVINPHPLIVKRGSLWMSQNENAGYER